MEKELLLRTKQFALEVLKLFLRIKRSEEGRILGRQLLRSATSVGANYRSACVARSRREFYAKMCIVVEEAHESGYWLELLEEGNLQKAEALNMLKKEAQELYYIFSASRRTAKG